MTKYRINVEDVPEEVEADDISEALETVEEHISIVEVE